MAFGPNSFNDPLYAQLALAAEQKFGLPTGILDAVRTIGERSNANQVSPAGARTVYQFIPATRQGFIKRYGIDPWSGPEAATEAAAIHLRDDYKRTGSWDEAIARYNGGQHPGSAAHAYASKVGDFDNGDTNMALGQSRYPQPYYGADPLAPLPDANAALAPEPVQQTVPIGGPGMSVAVPAASPVASRKRGGILGALESIFMPDPDSRWAGALRDGLTNAKESQQNYREQQAAKALDLATANAKLKQMLTKGEFQVVGNNVFHIPADGSPPEMISGPSATDDKVKLIDMWNQRHAANPNDPTLHLLEGLILGGANVPEVIAGKNAEAEKIARIRAGATTEAAKIRGAQTNPQVVVPNGWSVVK
jgi:hypothetical protein